MLPDIFFYLSRNFRLMFLTRRKSAESLHSLRHGRLTFYFSVHPGDDLQRLCSLLWSGSSLLLYTPPTRLTMFS